MISTAVRRFPAAIAVLGLVVYATIYTLHISDRPIRSDGVSYYEYLPAWIADGDPTFETLALDCCQGYDRQQPVGIHRWPATGRWLDVHPIGVAVLMLPFFLAAHALTWWSNLPRDGFSLYYQYVVGLSGLAYCVAGLAVLGRLLCRHFSDAVVLATLVCITFGTNLFHYAVWDSTFSHAFSFFLIACLLLLTEGWWEAPSGWRSAALGAVAALIVLVRHTNALFLLIVPFYGVTGPSSLRANLERLGHRWRSVAVIVVTGAAGVSPQLLVYRWATGHWIVNAYPEGSFAFGSPHVVATLFSVERGLFFWSPLLLGSVAGLVLARGWARGLAGVTLGVLAVDTYLMSCWFMWDLGAGYGHRGYVDAFPLFAIYLATLLEWTARRPGRARTAAVIAGLLVTLSLVQMWQYWIGIMPNEHTTWAQYRAVFLRIR